MMACFSVPGKAQKQLSAVSYQRSAGTIRKLTTKGAKADEKGKTEPYIRDPRDVPDLQESERHG
jgi:hypothetical protein